MGSKNLKAIVVRGTNDINVANKHEFMMASMDARTSYYILLQEKVEDYRLYGTQVLMNILNESHSLPTRNLATSWFEDGDKISGEFLTDNYLIRNKLVLLVLLVVEEL